MIATADGSEENPKSTNDSFHPDFVGNCDCALHPVANRAVWSGINNERGLLIRESKKQDDKDQGDKGKSPKGAMTAKCSGG